MEIISTIEKYLISIISDDFHRYKSWDNCFQAFKTPEQSYTQVLELAFYLSSWELYRGSGGLLQKNHLIHKGAVEIVFLKKNQKLKCNQINEVKRKKIDAILELKNQLANHYSSIYFAKGVAKPKPISPTDTLLSKIILGTLGCVPAYDRYFINGLKEMKLKYHTFDIDSLNELFDFWIFKKKEIENAQKIIWEKTQTYYPLMKIVDMYFWQTGYEIELSEK